MAISRKRVIVTYLIVDLLDIVMNLAVALLTGSMVMLTETIQGVADVVTDMLLVVGFYRSGLPADQSKPFGYGKEAFYWAMVANFVMLVFTAGLSLYLGWERFLNPESVDMIGLTYVTLSISLVANFYSLSLSLRQMLGKRQLKKVLRTVLDTPYALTKTAFVLDLVGFLAALIGLVFLIMYGITGWQRFDGLGAMMVGMILAGLSVVLLFSLKDLIVGKSAGWYLENKIRQKALGIARVEEVLDLKTMYVGPEKLLVNLELHFADNLNTDELEKVIDQVKQELRSAIPIIDHVQVEAETPEPKKRHKK